MSAPDRDPLGESDSAPAIGFKGDPIGTVKSIVINGPLKPDVHSKNFATGELDYWPAKNGEKPNPKLAHVFNGVDPKTGEPVSLWLAVPSDLLSRTKEAQKRDLGGKRADSGVRIDVKLANREDVGKGNPANRHAVKMTPAPVVDPLGDDEFGEAPF